MAKVGAQRAADLTGKSKSTIQRAMNSGKLSYELDPNGRRVIDVSELDRAFGLNQNSSAPAAPTVEEELEKASVLIEMERIKMRVKMLENQLEAAESQIEDLKAQRDQWQKQASQMLITSQYSQKQAEDLAEQLKERERRARERREKMEQQKLEERMKKMQADNQNAQDEDDNESEGAFGGLWKRVKGGR
ncbi:MAG: entry exclusion 1 domain-containing protein [Rhodospirillales bacterium]|nr:entry exclusion 1 domain-containing protein [Alphaproteobacteria bacterium]USO04912.1 MAG: entry exclusion 1 domain-containing protein [Rhodospirillales bacterium]